MFILGMLVPNSRDQHEKMATKFYIPQNTTYRKSALFEKSRLKFTSNTINNIAML